MVLEQDFDQVTSSVIRRQAFERQLTADVVYALDSERETRGRETDRGEDRGICSQNTRTYTRKHAHCSPSFLLSALPLSPACRMYRLRRWTPRKIACAWSTCIEAAWWWTCTFCLARRMKRPRRISPTNLSSWCVCVHVCVCVCVCLCLCFCLCLTV